MYKIYDGELFLFAVDTKYEADEQQEQGFRVVVGQFIFSPFSREQVGSGPGFMAGTLKKGACLFDLFILSVYNKRKYMP